MAGCEAGAADHVVTPRTKRKQSRCGEMRYMYCQINNRFLKKKWNLKGNTLEHGHHDIVVPRFAVVHEDQKQKHLSAGFGCSYGGTLRLFPLSQQESLAHMRTKFSASLGLWPLGRRSFGASWCREPHPPARGPKWEIAIGDKVIRSSEGRSRDRCPEDAPGPCQMQMPCRSLRHGRM